MASTIETIFISHAHQDEAYVKELVDIIKVTGVENKGIKIFCTSIPGHDIPGDENIFDYLKGELSGNVWVVYVLSQHYYSSPVCLNEMGATWILNKRYSTFLTPNFSFTQIKGAVDPSQNSSLLDQKNKYNDFKRLLMEDFQLEVNDNVWESVRDNAIDNIKNLAKQELEDNQMAMMKFESVAYINDETIKVVFRIINNNSFPIDFTFVKFILTDSLENEFVYEDSTLNTRCFYEENKLVSREYSLTNSSYTAARNKKGQVLNFISSKVVYI